MGDWCVQLGPIEQETPGADRVAVLPLILRTQRPYDCSDVFCQSWVIYSQFVSNYVWDEGFEVECWVNICTPIHYCDPWPPPNLV